MPPLVFSSVAWFKSAAVAPGRTYLGRSQCAAVNGSTVTGRSHPERTNKVNYIVETPHMCTVDGCILHAYLTLATALAQDYALAKENCE